MASTHPPGTDGIAVPADESGRRSTTRFAKAVLSAALAEVAPEAAAAVEVESAWRSNYHRHFVAAAQAGVTSPENAIQIAERGLANIHGQLRFVRDGEDRQLEDVMRSPGTASHFDTGVLPGVPGPTPMYAVPYRGLDLAGDDLRRQLESWVGAGVIEASAAGGVEEVLDNPDWLDLSDQTIVLMGAAAELGPYATLMGLGATVAAIDLPEPRIWDRLLTSAGGSSRLLHPVRNGQAGADLTRDLPEVRDWIRAIEGPIVLGGHAYADGEAHLRVSAAQDVLIADAIASRGRSEVTVAHLLTPTDCYAVSEGVADASRQAWDHRPLPLKATQALLRAATRGRLFQPAITDWVDGKDGYRAAVLDTLVTQQGPNYALAKRLQEWRAVAARAAGLRVSANIGPSSNTRSVTKNKALAAAYRGADMFGIEVFEPDTTNALMGLLLIRDLRTVTGPADPHVRLANPVELLTDAAVHGGLWRSPYTTRTALPLAAVKGFVTR